ncbi:hypothetical protein [Magnetococcus marinus]|uniref:hypothetical protein n=1 Tax=Magnetococcus marinus TaxID=1124597 RepID=UPI00003C56E0|nr:hypothetical protein [Magnetococcus marinus]
MSILLPSLTTVAQGATCPEGVTPQVKLLWVPAQADTVQRISPQVLHAKRGSAHLRGFTTTRFFDNAQFIYQITPHTQGHLCLQMQALNMKIGYGQTAMFSEDSYPPESCNSRVIASHEQQHLRIYNQTLLAQLPALKKRLLQTLHTLVLPATKQTLPQRQQEMEQPIKQLIALSTERAFKQVHQHNARIDTLENDRLVHAQCPHW